MTLKMTDVNPGTATVEVLEHVDHGENFPSWTECVPPLLGEIVDIDPKDPQNPVMVYIEGDGYSMFRTRSLRPLTKLAEQLIASAKETEVD